MLSQLSYGPVTAIIPSAGERGQFVCIYATTDEPRFGIEKPLTQRSDCAGGTESLKIGGADPLQQRWI